MLADFKVVLDACVLANIGVCDLFLRLAERPRLFLPRWSVEILNETRRVQADKLNWPSHLVEKWRRDVQNSFPEASVGDYQHLIPQLKNDEKDRHVLAAAIRSGASVIVTFNLKDFREEALSPWEIEAVHPQEYLLTLYSMSPEVVVLKLNQMARKRNREFIDLLLHLGKVMPAFTSHLIDDLGLEI
jgi:predicted nucleic acid-binding protein